MKMRVQKLDNRYSKTSTMITVDIEDFIEKPVSNIAKDDLPMCNFWINNKGVRDSKNCTDLVALFLDYDGGLTIQEFCMKYYSYQFYLYTTSSHTKEKNKFRVIIPMSACLSGDDYTSEVRKALEYKFPECDPTAFYKDHYFYVPAVPGSVGDPSENNNRQESYIYKINYGKLFNPKILTAVQLANRMTDDMKPKRVYAEVEEKLLADRENMAARRIKEILGRQDGTGRYNDLLKTIWIARKNGVSDRFLERQLSGYHNKNQILK